MSVYKYVYKIGVTFQTLSASEALPLSELDRKDGFIHLSTRDQVPGTVGRFFQDQNKITLLKIPLTSIESKLKWEQSSSHGTFPHIYGDLLGKDICERKVYQIEDASQWERTLLQDAEFLE